jgi:murein DD-endopeptidase MepM/ murein hydrolase activator NlpD
MFGRYSKRTSHPQIPPTRLVDNGCEVKQGDRLGLTGNSGNAHNTPPHLHFEIRRHAHLGKGLHGRVNPGEILGFQYYQRYA